jgi:hypothetical protein
MCRRRNLASPNRRPKFSPARPRCSPRRACRSRRHRRCSGKNRRIATLRRARPNRLAKFPPTHHRGNRTSDRWSRRLRCRSGKSPRIEFLRQASPNRPRNLTTRRRCNPSHAFRSRHPCRSSGKSRRTVPLTPASLNRRAEVLANPPSIQSQSGLAIVSSVLQRSEEPAGHAAVETRSDRRSARADVRLSAATADAASGSSGLLTPHAPSQAVAMPGLRSEPVAAPSAPVRIDFRSSNRHEALWQPKQQSANRRRALRPKHRSALWNPPRSCPRRHPQCGRPKQRPRSRWCARPRSGRHRERSLPGQCRWSGLPPSSLRHRRRERSQRSPCRRLDRVRRHQWHVPAR